MLIQQENCNLSILLNRPEFISRLKFSNSWEKKKEKEEKKEKEVDKHG